MKSILKKELPIWGIIVLPLIYLAFVWNQLPDKVPVHWNMNGEVDRYGAIHEIALLATLPFWFYLLLLLIPKIDPKNKLYKMGSKFQRLKFWLTLVFAIIAVMIVYSATHQSLVMPGYMGVIAGILLIILGNYFKTIQPNYFIGIRTPWTLESEIVWKATHLLAGKMWFSGGLLLVLTSLLISKNSQTYVVISLVTVISLIPIVYSYFKFTAIKKHNTAT